MGDRPVKTGAISYKLKSEEGKRPTPGAILTNESTMRRRTVRMRDRYAVSA